MNLILRQQQVVQQGTALVLPRNLTASFTVDTISGQLNWTDTNHGLAQYEIYSSTNGVAFALLATTATGATSYQDTTCKQNASVIYMIRAKRGSYASGYVVATPLSTPLCWKTNQSTLTAHVINALNITAGKTVTVNYSDGTSQAYTGDNTNITKNFSTTGQYDVWLSGDTNYITTFNHNTQSKTYGIVTNWVLSSTLAKFYINSTGLTGVVTNWVLPSTLAKFYISSTGLTGVVTNWVLPSTLDTFYINSTGLTGIVTNWVLPSNLTNFNIYSTGLTGIITNWVLPSTLVYFAIALTGVTGSLPQITGHATNDLSYQAQGCYISDSGVTVFRKAMTVYNISGQNVVWSTAKIDAELLKLADWYQTNAPTANCTFTMNGGNMGIPTGGASNTNLIRLVGYYTAAGKTATVVVRTS